MAPGPGLIVFTGAGPERHIGTMKTSTSGFSLVETLIALAIASVVSLALFQSVSQWLLVSTRASAAADRALTRVSVQRTFEHIVAGMQPGWPEEEGVFHGTRHEMTGLSHGMPLAHPSPPRPVTLRLLSGSEARAGLAFEAGGETLEVFRLPAQIAVFSYLGPDLVWREAWPPEVPPGAGPVDRATLADIAPLPRAMRCCFDLPDRRVCWIARPGSDFPRPVRASDF